MKVLLYSHEFPPFLGGLATTSLKLAEGISNKGNDLTALVPSYGGEQKAFDDASDFNIKRIPLLGNKLVKGIPFVPQIIGFFFLAYYLKKIRPDVVLFVTEEAESVGGLVSNFISFRSVVRVAGSGIVTCFHGSSFHKSILKYPMSTLYKKTDRVVAVSNYTKSLLEDIGVNSGKIRVIYNGVYSSLLTDPVNIDSVESLRQKYGIEKTDRIIVTIARVLPRKGQDNVIRSIPKILEEVPGLKYLVVGEGKYKKDFEQLADDLGVADKVIFTGGVENSRINDYLDLSDIFIMPNRLWNNKVEGLPNAIIEASARGLPVIAGNHSGSVEAVVHGETGFLVEAEDPEKIGEALIELLTDKEKLESFGKNGKQFIKNNFSTTVVP